MENYLKRKAKRHRQPTRQRGFGFEMPPDRELVDIYFDQKGQREQAALFYRHYGDAGWCSPKGSPYRNWKTLATDWIYDHEQAVKLQQRLAAKNSVFRDL